MATIIPNFVQAECQRGEGRSYDVFAGTDASITVGDVVILDSVNAGYVKAVGTAQVTSADTVVGFALSDSDETASADGIVLVNDEVTTQVWRGKALTPANLTQAVKNTKVTIDSAADGVQTIDEDNTTNGVAVIVDFDADKGTVDFKLGLSSTLVN